MRAAFLLFALTLALPARAENQLGLLLGMNRASVEEGAEAENFFPMIGVFGELAFTPELAMEGQVRYLKKGGDVTRALEAVTASRNFEAEESMGFLEFPVYARLHFLPGEVFDPYLFGGPVVGLRLSHELEVRDRTTGAALPPFVAPTEKDEIDIALEAGTGAQFHLGDTFNGRVSVAYSHGLRNLQSGGGDYFSRGLQVYAGLALHF